MSIWQRIRAFFGRGKVVAIKAASNTYERFKSWFEPYNIFTRMALGTLASNETIFSAVSRLSNSMGSLPLKLFRDFKAVEGSSIADLLVNSPNPNMTGFDFIRTLEACRNTSGNGYALKEYDSRYRVRALWILDPGKVTPVIERDSQELWYRVQGDKGIYHVHNMDMIHVKHVHGYGYQGVSPIDVLRNTIDFDTKVKAFSLDQIDGAIKASFVLQMATSLAEDKKKAVLESFKRFYKENGGVLLQEMGVKIDPIKREYIDTKIFEVERITRTRVASVFNMPVSLLGETEGQGYQSREQMALEYVQDTLAPICVQYEKEFNRKLLSPETRRQGFYWKFNLNALLRGDFSKRLDGYFKGVRSAVYTPNDVRALEDLPPVEGGDVLYISKDMIPLTQLATPNTPPTPPNAAGKERTKGGSTDD